MFACFSKNKILISFIEAKNVIKKQKRDCFYLFYILAQTRAECKGWFEKEKKQIHQTSTQQASKKCASYDYV